MWKRWTLGIFFSIGWLLMSADVAVRGGSSIERMGATLIQDFEGDFDRQAVSSLGEAEISVVSDLRGTQLRVTTSHLEEDPGVSLGAPQGGWDLARHQAVEIEVYNPSVHPVWIYGAVESSGVEGCDENLGSVKVPAMSGRTLTILFRRVAPTEGSLLDRSFIGMRGLPGGYVRHWCTIDPSQVREIRVFLPESRVNQVFQIDNVRAVGTYSPPSAHALENGFFPFVDEYGQYKYKDWPGKVYSDADLKQADRSEEIELAKFPGPSEWTQYGGWLEGPLLESTGSFRVVRYQGKWWFVDPEGRLFWSHGIDCVRPSNAETPLRDREHYFEVLPDEDSPFSQFYGERQGASRGYYQSLPTRTYNFTGANLYRKYGEDWYDAFTRRTHRRLRSWGVNTIGNWSTEEIYLQKKTPYVVNIGFSSRSIEGSEGTWGRFPDVFDESFRENLRSRLAQEQGKSIGDPWCLGYFVSNELTWGSDEYLSLSVLRSPADQPAKRAFVDDLRSKYGEIDDLNRAWGTEHVSWDSLLDSRDTPGPENLREDLEAFSRKLADTYFRTIREEIKEAAPETLYLGCRFSSSNEIAVRSCAEHCDVVSFNKYQRSLAGFALPEGIDRPVIIGEFHFGALDRGKLHTGLRSVANQVERGEAYQHYVETALLHPSIIGTHWFQYGDQATTGRFDGENYQIGFLTMCDTPYPETVQAAREVGYGLYRFRLTGKKD